MVGLSRGFVYRGEKTGMIRPSSGKEDTVTNGEHAPFLSASCLWMREGVYDKHRTVSLSSCF